MRFAFAPHVRSSGARWHDAGADRRELRERWQDLQLYIFDLPDNLLAAQAGDDIIIDVNAAGHGWFIDATPDTDAEFPIIVADTERRAEQGDTFGRVDLLATLIHESAHWLGLPHYSPDDFPHNVMVDTLPPSTRRTPADGQGDVQPLRLEGHERDTRTKLELRPTDLRPIIHFAAAFWTEQGIPRADVRQLFDIEVRIADLPDDYLGLTTDAGVWVDSGLRRREVSAVIVHEFGHVLDLSHDDGGVMSAAPRRDQRILAAVFGDWNDWRWEGPNFFRAAG